MKCNVMPFFGVFAIAMTFVTLTELSIAHGLVLALLTQCMFQRSNGLLPVYALWVWLAIAAIHLYIVIRLSSMDPKLPIGYAVLFTGCCFASTLGALFSAREPYE